MEITVILLGPKTRAAIIIPGPKDCNQVFHVDPDKRSAYLSSLVPVNAI